MKNPDEGVAEGEQPADGPRRKKRPTKKTATKKASGKKAPARKRGKKDEPEAVGAAPEAVEAAPEPIDEVEDAEILAETVIEQVEGTESAPAVDVVETAPLSDEERELAEVYGEEIEKPAIAHAEFSDRQTRDEDRQMMPEINAREERRNQWQERRDRRKRDREERRQRREQQGPGQGRTSDFGPRTSGGEHRPPPQPPRGSSPEIRPQAEARSPRPEAPAPNGADALGRVGTPLGDAAAQVFAQLRNGQPLPVRQLAAMMRKRALVNQDPEQLWPQLKAELLGDERSYRALGLRPRIVYRGRDLFAPGPVAMSATADAEAGVANALSRLAGATHRVLAARIAKASPAGFERLIHAYLVAAGYRDIEWVKRVGGISYATALAPGLERQVLISARSGDQPIDRRGIGELRVGVEAKDLVAGILFSAREVSEDAESELQRAGRSISVVCGDQLVAALVASGVGVVSAAAPLHYVDDTLLDELLAG